MSWHLHPDVILWIALLQFAYVYGLRRVGRPRGKSATRAQVTWWTAGVVVLYIGAGTPIHDIAEQRLFSIHMVQHTLFTLVAPPLLLLGTPAWLLDPLLERRAVRQALYMLTRPLLAFVLFNSITLVTHIPFMVNLSLEHHWVHFFVHLVLIASATLMWWPAMSPDRRLPGLSPALAMIYLFVQSLVPSVLASFITFASKPLYEFYASAPRLWGMSVVTDQRTAGLIMKLGGGAILWVAIGIVFFGWVAREGKQERLTAAPIRWDDVEEELGRMGLTKPGAPST